MATAKLLSKPRIIRHVAASVIGTAFVLGFGAMPPLLAQQPSPPPWTQGRPPEQASSPLAPHPQPPAPKPKDIPIDKVKLPPGFKIEIWADTLPNARSMALGSKATLFVGSRGAGHVYAVVEGGTREGKVITKGLQQPNGIAFRDGSLHMDQISRITKYEGMEGSMTMAAQPLSQEDIETLAHYIAALGPMS
jgi:hypothetical protein